MTENNKYRPGIVSPEGTVVRWERYNASGSEVPPPTIDEVPPYGVTGQLTKEKPVKPNDNKEKALREQAYRKAQKAYGPDDEGLPYWAK